MNIVISSFCGLCSEAIHYYAKLYITVSNVCGNSSVSGYLDGIEIPNEYQTIEGEFVRPLTQKEKDEQTGCIQCFTSKVKNLCAVYRSYRFAKLKYVEVVDKSTDKEVAYED